MLGGCSSTTQQKQPEQLPQTAAFQDKDTRGYLKSTTETAPGYYTLESKTGGYSMLFPTEANINPDFGEYHPNYFEQLYFGKTNYRVNDTYSFTMIYENKPSNKYINATLGAISDATRYNGNYQKQETHKYLYYTAENPQLLEGVKVTYLLAYVKSRNTNQGIQVIYSFRKKQANIQTRLDIQKHKENFNKVLKSIRFKTGEPNK